jgi:hypothetical protein
MSDSVDELILDLLEWLGPEPRPYTEVLDAWRTSCPRLPVWEEANDRGFIERRSLPGRGAFITVSAAGTEHLSRNRPFVRAASRDTTSPNAGNRGRSGDHRYEAASRP